MTPAENLAALKRNPYPGRGIVMGLNAAGDRMVQAYWIMGRSDNSRNRLFVAEGSTLRTAPADPSKVKDPSLIIYHAMLETNGAHIVTNGDQTDTIADALRNGATFRDALMSRQYEPDAPNYTPRISGILAFDRAGKPRVELSILKKSEFGEGCDRQFFLFESFAPGIGACVTTYMGDGDPLPAFRGEPYALPLDGDSAAIANALWNCLNDANRISLAVKSIPLGGGAAEIHTINKYK